MVAIADAIKVLFPNAIPLVDYTVADVGSGPFIAQWNLQAPQPTQAELDAVTEDQVKAATTKLFPFELMALFRPLQLVQIMTSTDPTTIVIRTKLQTIVSPMPMAGMDMQQALGYLALQGIITPEEIGKLTRGENLN